MRKILFGGAARSEAGQGMAEYASILALAAIVTVAIVTVLGQTVNRQYCHLMLELFPGSDVSDSCAAPYGTLAMLERGPYHIQVEALVTDPDAPGGDPYGAVSRVEFFIDDPGGSPVQTEFHHHYCLGGGDSLPCGNFDIRGLAAGEHTVFAKIYDIDDNVGTASLSFTK